MRKLYGYKPSEWMTRRCEDNIKMKPTEIYGEETNCIELVQNMIQYQNFVAMMMNLVTLPRTVTGSIFI